MARPVVPIAQIARRLPELGRIKDGVRVAGKGHPKAIDTLRFTSQDPKALAQVAATLGGEVKAYSDPKSTDTHELITPVAETPVILPPDPLGGTPMYELYGGGGRERWCDGVTCEQWRKGPEGPEPFEVPCLCAAAGELTCRPTVHLSVILPFTRLGGTWRWTTHSHNAAVELPGMVEAIQSLQAKGLTRGVLRVDQRSQTIAGVTRRFVVPVLGVDATADELASGQATLGLGSGAAPAIATSEVAAIEAGGAPTSPREPSGAVDTPASAPLPPEPERVTAELVTATSEPGGESEADGSPPVAVPQSTARTVAPSGLPPDTDTLDLLRQAIAKTPRMTEGKALKRARELAQELGLQHLPTDFDSLPRFPQVLASLAAELVEAP